MMTALSSAFRRDGHVRRVRVVVAACCLAVWFSSFALAKKRACWKTAKEALFAGQKADAVRLHRKAADCYCGESDTAGTAEAGRRLAMLFACGRERLAAGQLTEAIDRLEQFLALKVIDPQLRTKNYQGRRRDAEHMLGEARAKEADRARAREDARKAEARKKAEATAPKPPPAVVSNPVSVTPLEEHSGSNAPWIIGGAGAVALAAGGWFNYRHHDDYDESAAKYAAYRDSEAAAFKEDARLARNLSVAGYAVGSALLTTALVWLWVETVGK